MTEDPLAPMPGRDSVSALTEMVKLAKDNPSMREAGDYAAKALAAIGKTAYHLTFPLRVLNYASDGVERYFEERFASELEERLQLIPEENRSLPKTYVAGPALQGLADTVDEPALRKLYLELLARAMDDREAERVHPSFTSVIAQLDPDEVIRLSALFNLGHSAVPLAEIRFAYDRGRGEHESEWPFVAIKSHVLPKLTQPDPYFEPSDVKSRPEWVDNWVRLGLVEISYTQELKPGSNNAYLWVQRSQDWAEAEISLADSVTPDVRRVVFQRGKISPSAFGLKFARTVGIVEDS
ncbi:DUF4393 domain-containing protein [Microbacterium oryzae]|uniref:DUF4393 domain-containing protein n=1 Tax=Microbacterium oryzae TaxID=743009 RepID=UPI0025B2551D|nr:DUF4393 domain-containing protein [Microbacterium oryzae]MDN3310635.1 DUF4393 domain-containing protein [Microbacterium oryzae]